MLHLLVVKIVRPWGGMIFFFARKGRCIAPGQRIPPGGRLFGGPGFWEMIRDPWPTEDHCFPPPNLCGDNFPWELGKVSQHSPNQNHQTDLRVECGYRGFSCGRRHHNLFARLSKGSHLLAWTFYSANHPGIVPPSLAPPPIDLHLMRKFFKGLTRPLFLTTRLLGGR